MRRGGRTRKIEHLQTPIEVKYLKATAETLLRDSCFTFLYKVLPYVGIKTSQSVECAAQRMTGDRQAGVLPFNAKTRLNMEGVERKKTQN